MKLIKIIRFLADLKSLVEEIQCKRMVMLLLQSANYLLDMFELLLSHFMMPLRTSGEIITEVLTHTRGLCRTEIYEKHYNRISPVRYPENWFETKSWYWGNHTWNFLCCSKSFSQECCWVCHVIIRNRTKTVEQWRWDFTFPESGTNFHWYRKL